MAHDRKFRFGVQASGAATASEWRDFARMVEDLGYSTLFMPDHFVDTQLAPMVGIAFAAEATTRLRVGHLVLGNDYKHPAVVAKEAATIDLLSDGRLELGLGAGWMRTDYDALGLTYDAPGTRIERLAEALDVVKGSWGPGPFDFDGEHYTIAGYDGLPKPVQSPHPPILVGGGGPRLLRLAGREADIVGINPNLRAGAVGPDTLKDAVADVTARKVGWVREGAGDRFDDLELQIRYFIAAVTDNPKGLGEAIAPGFGMTTDELLTSGTALVGTVDSCIDTLRERRETWGVSYLVLGQDNFEAFAPVVAALAGT
ncbi:MAG: TIGR03621 family F420-dependent LLM class oxidoreductase [Acidimicrobiia bacterium]|jgi:probable F420-dependent oxidoreductase|nr:TIGR03621 family F420-dependent LLM class oxidoreductase [Acidimicrobiia bacterium]